MAVLQDLLTERLRPKKFEHLILPKRIKTALGNGKIGQNVLLYGSPGTGKTSAAKVLAGSSPYLYINVSDESSVEIIRTTITEFCSSISVDFSDDDAPKQENGLPVKVVILDEMEGASEQFFKALRVTVEKYAKNCRFIATTNFINKIPDHIQSRFECINFDFISKEEEKEISSEWSGRLGLIFEKVGIEIDDESKREFISRYFPDMRSALNRIQSFQIQGVKKLTKEKILESNWDFEDLYKLISGKPDPVSNYEYIIGNYSTMVEDVMAKLGTEFIQWIKEKQPDKTKAIPQIIISTASHQAQRNQVIDQAVSLLSLCFTIQKILNP